MDKIEDKNFVVYEHYTQDTNELFYVGEGRPERAKSKRFRNRYWNFKVNKHGGFTIKIVHKDITKKEAEQIEKELIAEYRSENIELTNMCESTFTGDTHWLVNKPKELHPMFGTKRPEQSERMKEYNETHKGETHPKYGTKNEALAERNKTGSFNRFSKKIYCIELDKTFNSLKEAKIFLGGNPNLNRGLKSGSLVKGYHWKYI